MSHNEFDFYKDLIRPMLKFFFKIGLDTGPSRRVPKMTLDEIFYTDQDFERHFRREKMKNYKCKKGREVNKDKLLK